MQVAVVLYLTFFTGRVNYYLIQRFAPNRGFILLLVIKYQSKKTLDKGFFLWYDMQVFPLTKGLLLKKDLWRLCAYYSTVSKKRPQGGYKED